MSVQAPSGLIIPVNTFHVKMSRVGILDDSMSQVSVAKFYVVNLKIR